MACEANSSMENNQPSEGRRIDADLQVPLRTILQRVVAYDSRAKIVTAAFAPRPTVCASASRHPSTWYPRARP